jgi:acyl carrier protein
MAARGAKFLVLITTRGADTPEKRDFLEELKQAGVNVKLVYANVADRNTMTGLFEELGKNNPPVKGIFHLAGTLDDGVLALQNAERFEKVMAPKALGAWHLHQLTSGLSLDFFVCFSSMASVLGSPGQGNYAAANGFLDGLAHYRHALGLPALTINWGQWKETGMAARLDEKQKTRLNLMGLKAFDVDQGLKVLDAALQEKHPQLAAAALDWSRLGTYRAVPQTVMLQQLKSAGGAKQHELICAYLKKTVCSVMDFEETELDADRSFIELGIDSLMAVEVKNKLTRELGIELPVIRFMEGATANQLADYIQEALVRPSSSESAEPGRVQEADGSISPEKARELLTQLDNLSEEETERLLKLLD